MKKSYKIILVAIAPSIVAMAGVFAWWTAFGKYYPVTPNEIACFAALIGLGSVSGSIAGIFAEKKRHRLTSALIPAFLIAVAPSLLYIPWNYYMDSFHQKDFSLAKSISVMILYIVPGVSLVSGITSLICCSAIYTILESCSSSKRMRDAEQGVAPNGP